MIKCKVCDIDFTPPHFNTKICSPECRLKSKKKASKKWTNENIVRKDNLAELEIFEKEEFISIIGFNENYKISNFGRIYSRKLQGFLKPNLSPNGYFTISLCNGKHKKYLLHRLIAIHFIKNPNPEKFTIVDHIDRNRTNNSISNLRWADYKINSANSASVIFRKGSIWKTNDKIVCKGKEYVYHYWRFTYYKGDMVIRSKRFANEELARKEFTRLSSLHATQVE